MNTNARPRPLSRAERVCQSHAAGAGPGLQRPVWKLFAILLDAEHPQAPGVIVRQRRWMVEVARVHPDPGRAHVPGPGDRGREQLAAHSLADESREQPEVGDLHVAFALALELE